LAQTQLFQESIIADYFFIKTLLFAKNNLKEEEYRLFQRLFQVLNSTFPKPDLLVYLHRPIERLMYQIRQRGRAFEQDITSAYLEQIQASYLEFFRTENALPILIIELEDLDFANDPNGYQLVKDLIFQQYTPGLHRIKP
jgi:deoxyadenosine/deoxycytidine kinase